MEATIIVKIADIEQLAVLLRAVSHHAEMRGFTLDPPGAISDTDQRNLPQRVRARLTPTEWQMIELAALGVTRSRIAAQLNLSPWSVSTYWARIYGKLGVHTRSAMLDWYRTNAARSTPPPPMQRDSTG